MKDTSKGYAFGVGIIIVIIAIVFLIFGRTASCQRSCVSMKSNIAGGLNRTVNVYTANGDLIASYEGKIDLDANDGGYVLFDFNGKRYAYYNCFVESIADIN